MKIALYSILSLLLLILAGGLLISSEFKLEQEIVVEKPKAEVFESLRFLKSHHAWNAWSKKDPGLKKEFVGQDGEGGFRASWSSRNEELGVAEQEIMRVINGERIETQIRYTEPFEASFDSYLITRAVSEKQTRVIMGLADELPFPMNVVSFIYHVCLGNQKKLERDLGVSLANFKKQIEASSSP